MYLGISGTPKYHSNSTSATHRVIDLRKPPSELLNTTMASSVASYRLETPRPRPPPLPIRSRHTMSPSPSRLSASKEPDQPLLYDLPTATTMSTTYSASRVGSPISPNARSQSRASRGRHMTPPPSNRAPTPSRPLERDLENFAELCRAWYVHLLTFLA